MGLQRKKVTVRTKKGKVYQRSMLVKGTTQKSLNRGGKLHSLSPWEARHIDHVDDTIWRQGKIIRNPSVALSRGSSGPGSSHSAYAHLVGLLKSKSHPALDIEEHESGHAAHAIARRDSGAGWAAYVMREPRGPTRPIAQQFDVAHRIQRDGPQRANIIAHYGARNVHEVHQDPRKWVRE